MNRMMMFAFSLMLVLAFISVLYGSGYATVSDGRNISGSINGTETSMRVDLVGSIMSSEAVYFILLGAIGLGIAAGISVFGSGIDSFSVQLIFSLGIYGGVWLILSGMAWPMISMGSLSVISGMFYAGITILFILGFASDNITAGG